MFELAAGLDRAELAALFAEHGRVQVTNFLGGEGAMRLYDELADSTEWRLTVNRGEEIHHFALEDLARWTPRQHELLDRAVNFGGRYDFQFRYEVIRTEASTGPALLAFCDFISSPELIEFMRTVTGASDISFADVHASRYQPGHFLTLHDDQSEGMGRRAAYVLNLTPEWRADWGGLLQFLDPLGNVSRAFTPAFNVLTLFAVPQRHSVSWVTDLAAAPRYAITGWLRTSGADVAATPTRSAE